MRIIAVITGIALMATGIWCFAQRGTVFLSIAFLLGCVMVCAGVLSILIYFFAPGGQKGFGWFLSEGILTVMLGGVVLSNQLLTDPVILHFFGMWILFSGVIRLVASLHLAMAKNNSWFVYLTIGFVSSVAGLYTFFNQIMFGITVIIRTGVYVLIQGVNILVYAVFIPKKAKKPLGGGGNDV
jgi:uncharacterized membrane protein HdeD (DUF308 family)